MEVLDQPRRTRMQRPGGRVALFCSVRPEIKARVAEAALEADVSLSAYVADLVAAHVGMEP